MSSSLPTKSTRDALLTPSEQQLAREGKWPFDDDAADTAIWTCDGCCLTWSTQIVRPPGGALVATLREGQDRCTYCELPLRRLC